MAAVVIAVVAVVSTIGGSSKPDHAARAETSGGVSSHRARDAAGQKPPPEQVTHSHRASPPPGTLPQTRARPSSTSAQFKALMGALWTGVVRDSLGQGMPAFFPKAAYLQVKAIPDAGGNYDIWLVHDFKVDIGAAHALLGAGAARARLVGVRVPQSFAHWVGPGACYNRIGYWEVPNARVVYDQNGHVRSFGIASMISWRGVWYVIHFGVLNHLGAALESGAVDSPAAGPGTSTDAGTC